MRIDADLQAKGYRAIAGLLGRSHLAAPFELPALIRECAAELGADGAVAYLVDLQQTHLVAFRHPDERVDAEVQWLPVGTTLAGRAFQHSAILSQVADTPNSSRVWVPLLDGAERVGVLEFTVDSALADRLVPTRSDGVREDQATGVFARFAAAVAEVVLIKTMYGDEIVRLRRRYEMDLAAELQWSLLPPLTFACRQAAIAGAVEPAYRVAGDALDYAVDDGIVRAAVFDGMGHSLRSGQLSALAIVAYRHARRLGLSLQATGSAVDEAMLDAFEGATFATAVIAELDTNTGVLSWLNAGHPAPLLLRDQHVVKALEVRPRAPLGLNLPPTLQSARAFTVGAEPLQPGDRVLLYTDGVTEARSRDGEMFGEQRLVDLLQRHFAAELPAAETLRRVIQALLEHQRGRLDDDATLLVVEWRPPDAGGIMPATAPDRMSEQRSQDDATSR